MGLYKRTSGGSQPLSHVNLLEKADVARWCRKLHCTERQLREAVEQVGPLPSNVEAFIRQRTRALEHVELPHGRKPS